MKFAKHYRRGILLLSAIITLSVVVSIGCSKSNESKIVGNWKAQSINSVDGTVQYVVFHFYKEGVVSKKTGIIINEQLSSPDKLIGKYKFSDDKKNLSITWDDGKSEITNVSFPQEDKMLLGKYEMDKIESRY